MAYARGKYAQAISDRSGLAFPYNEMVKEAKHPQIRKKHIKGDAIALANARPRPPENQKEFLLFISSGFFADNGDGGIGGTSMTVAQSDSILGTNLTAVSATSAVGTDFTVVIS